VHFGRKLPFLQLSTFVNENIVIVLDSGIDIVTYYFKFLADRTNGRAIATLLRLSSVVVCLWRYVLWLNGAS